MLVIEHSPRNFSFGLAPSPVFTGLTPLYFFSFLSIIPSSIFTFTVGYNPRPNVQFISAMCFSCLVFHIKVIQMYNMWGFFFFISASKISPRIKIYNMNLCAEIAESILLIKIQGLNNCMFGKLINIFLFG